VPTILVADDNSNIQKMVGIALKDQGIEVVAVGNGEAAVRKLAESIPDLILADIFMPVRNGYEVCEYVKKDDRFAHIPVVLLVGAFDPLDEHEVERVHADGVLKKPFVPPDPLIELVKSFLGKLAGAGPALADTQELPPEDVERTQDIAAGRSPTGTLRMPIAEVPPTERTQRLEPEPPPVERTQRLSSGTVEVPRPEAPPAGPVSAENFKLGLEEPPATPAMEKTQKLTASHISDILKRESALTTPPKAEEEEFSVPPAVVDLQGEGAPVAFEDLLQPTEEEEEAAEERAEESRPGLAAFEAAPEEAEEEHEKAQAHFGGIREEAKSPDPEMPPIPVEFGHSEPVEIITEEHMESSEMHIGPPEDLVSSASGWAASTPASGAHAPEPGLVSEGTEGFMTPVAPPAMGGIVREEAAPAPEFAMPTEAPAAAGAASELDETSDLPKHILQEEVNRAQEIAARIAAQNREFITQEESRGPAGGVPVTGPGIDQAISTVDNILARHRAQAAEAAPAAAAAAPAAVPPPVAEPIPAPTAELPAERVAPTVMVSRPAMPEMVEMISERVLAQLDPYLIEKISKEIVRPIVEAMIRRELEKLQ
jgi:CheY-like chemotaxis protein